MRSTASSPKHFASKLFSPSTGLDKNTEIVQVGSFIILIDVAEDALKASDDVTKGKLDPSKV